jgi:hypothetical protein
MPNLAADGSTDCRTDSCTQHVDDGFPSPGIRHWGRVADRSRVSYGCRVVYRGVVGWLWLLDVNGPVDVYRTVNIYRSLHNHSSVDVYGTLDDLAYRVVLLDDAALTVIVLTCPSSVVGERRHGRGEQCAGGKNVYRFSN